ncbi:NitT/TauT family transport system substrate-binding protein [Spinactinospora alkalitolerans]|uniref:Thiamine pyrimidine synthase n=1 Tax=Spinactinospora alkalitolerans TaxID=687207 RepID=A0A852TV42_9ACTN|nr:ABC transporter substrate-binding protein [Spinactinospora alkalitolerans]NYE47167.1 NitT/TauT family transport system substrate-binding protein [Spinactinospora alkalitolerans]
MRKRRLSIGMPPRAPHKALAGVLAAGLLAAVASCSGDGTDKITFGISVPTMSPGWIALAVAEKQGYFKAEGIEVLPQFLGSSGNVLQSMTVGRTEIGTPTPEALLPAIDKGQDVQMVYQWTRGPVQSFAVLPDSEIREVDDLRGKTIGVPDLSSGVKQLADASVSQAGMDPEKDVRYLSVDVGVAAWDALNRHRVDALMIWDTEYAAMENTGAELRYMRADGIDDLFSTTFAANREWSEEHPGDIEAFGRAWTKATIWASENPEEAVKVMWELYPETKTGRDEEDLLEDHVNILKAREESVLLGDPEVSGTWGEYDPDAVRKWVDFATETELISPGLDVDEVYTNRFAAAYNAFDPDSL